MFLRLLQINLIFANKIHISSIYIFIFVYLEILHLDLLYYSHNITFNVMNA
jgi:hypothetical protein